MAILPRFCCAKKIGIVDVLNSKLNALLSSAPFHTHRSYSPFQYKP